MMITKKEPEPSFREQNSAPIELTDSELSRIAGGKLRNNTECYDCPPGRQPNSSDCYLCTHRNECAGANGTPTERDGL